MRWRSMSGWNAAHRGPTPDCGTDGSLQRMRDANGDDRLAQGPQLSRSVGAGGRNKPIDVAEVEYLLRQSAPDPFDIAIDGVAGPDLLTGIVDFQTRALNQGDPSGLIRPKDAAARQLSSFAGNGPGPHRGDPRDGAERCRHAGEPRRAVHQPLQPAVRRRAVRARSSSSSSSRTTNASRTCAGSHTS